MGAMSIENPRRFKINELENEQERVSPALNEVGGRNKPQGSIARISKASIEEAKLFQFKWKLGLSDYKFEINPKRVYWENTSPFFT